MDLGYLYYNKIVKSKRQRERNWDRNEKKALIRLVQRYRPIIDNKGNDNIWIRRKNAAWEAIQRAMVAEGFRRNTKSVRQQWARTKGEAKKKQTNIKNEVEDQAEAETPVVIAVDPLCYTVKTEEVEPEELSNSLDMGNRISTGEDDADADGRIYENPNLQSADLILNGIHSPNFDNAESSGMGSRTPSTNESFLETPLQPPRPVDKKMLPKLPVGRNVLQARLKQIEEETAQKAELHLLEVTHRQEIHALRVQQMREQIEQQRRICEAQIAKLKSSK